MRLGVEAALVDGAFVSGDVDVVDGVVSAVGLASPNGRGVAVPGFVDLQVNGIAGVDFLDTDADGYRRAGEALLETGVTAYLPTLITSPERQTVAALGEVPGGEARPRVLGAHLEGPFLSPARPGVHDPSSLREPDPALLDRLLSAGPVRLVTLAPELEGAAQLIDVLLERGVAVSLGHSDATAAQANAAFGRGARCATHLFNAMAPLRHREPGIVGAALARDDVVVSIIVDGIHLAPETVRIVWRAAHGRVALVTDAVAGPTRRDDGVLAGGAATMIEAVRAVHALGVPLAEAVGAATAVPARVLGDEGIGRLGVGRPADVVVLDDGLEIVRVLAAGDAAS